MRGVAAMKSKIHPAPRATNCTAAFAMLAGALGLSSAQAVTLAPATYSIIFVQGLEPIAKSVIGATSPQEASYTVQEVNRNVNGGAGALATPAVSAGAGSGSCIVSCTGGIVEVTATVVYQIAVVLIGAPSGLRVLYNFETNGGITAIAPDGRFGSGDAHVSLTGPTAGFKA